MMKLDKWSKYSFILYAILVAGYWAQMLYSNYNRDNGSSISLVYEGLVFLWVISPQFFFYLIVGHFSKDSFKLAAFVLQIIAFALSLAAYIDAFYVHPDPQSALALIFIPLWQNLVIIVAFIVMKIVQMIQKRRTS